VIILVLNRPHENTIRNLIQTFQKNGSVDNVKPSGRETTIRTVENIIAVRESVSIIIVKRFIDSYKFLNTLDKLASFLNKDKRIS